MTFVLLDSTTFQFIPEFSARQGTESQVVINNLTEGDGEVRDVSIRLTDVLMKNKADPSSMRQR